MLFALRTLLPAGAVGVDALLRVAHLYHRGLADRALPPGVGDASPGPERVGLRAVGPLGASGEPLAGLGVQDPHPPRTAGGAGAEVVLLGVARTLRVDALDHGRVALPDDPELWESAHGAGGLHGLYERAPGHGICPLAVRVPVASDEVPVLGPLDRHVVPAGGADTDVLLRVECGLDLGPDLVRVLGDLDGHVVEHVLRFGDHRVQGPLSLGYAEHVGFKLSCHVRLGDAARKHDRYMYPAPYGPCKLPEEALSSKARDHVSGKASGYVKQIYAGCFQDRRCDQTVLKRYASIQIVAGSEPHGHKEVRPYDLPYCLYDPKMHPETSLHAAACICIGPPVRDR